MEKLFYTDCDMRTFSATVTGCYPAEKGWNITLNATAFYPEGGGQACDIGQLGGVNVLDVQEEDGEILHLCDGELPVGAVIEGRIDWERRFDLMQQHTGEHIVSGLIHETFGYHNTGFHVGKEVMEVDFDGVISPEILAEIELRANQAVWQNVAVNCRIPAQEELSTLSYRTKRALPWPVRIVEIPGYDSCACCGIHVKRTGQVGLIKILSCVKFHKGVRLEMVCGQRAYRHMVRIFEESRQVSRAFSVPMTQIGSAAEQMNALLAAEKMRCGALQRQIFDTVANRYAGEQDVIYFDSSLDGGQIRSLAEKIAGCISGVAAVFSGADGQWRYCLAAEREDLRTLCKAFNETFCGRGGGKPNVQQGTIFGAEAEIRRFFCANRQ